MTDELAIAEQDFPAGATDAAILRFLVTYAILAPSGHNAQPWLFRIRKRSLDVLADRTRALAVVDPRDRELTISCGAAVEHLPVAARRFGRDLAIDELPGSDPDILSPVGALCIRTFDLGNGVAASDRAKIIEGSPMLAVLSTENDVPSDWLATGRALSRVLLKLTESGATAAFLNQPIEVEQLRPRLELATGTTGFPQLLMRLGYAGAVKPSVRRPIEDVLI